MIFINKYTQYFESKTEYYFIEMNIGLDNIFYLFQLGIGYYLKEYASDGWFCRDMKYELFMNGVRFEYYLISINQPLYHFDSENYKELLLKHYENQSN